MRQPRNRHRYHLDTIAQLVLYYHYILHTPSRKATQNQLKSAQPNNQIQYFSTKLSKAYINHNGH